MQATEQQDCCLPCRCDEEEKERKKKDARPSPIRLARRACSRKRSDAEKMEISRQNVYGPRKRGLTHQTMFLCLECNKQFNGHKVLAEHVISRKHACTARQQVSTELNDWGSEPPIVFYCVPCGAELTTSELDGHIRLPRHREATLENTLQWYARWKPRESYESIARRHEQGIKDLDNALFTTYTDEVLPCEFGPISDLCT